MKYENIGRRLVRSPHRGKIPGAAKNLKMRAAENQMVEQPEGPFRASKGPFSSSASLLWGAGATGGFLHGLEGAVFVVGAALLRCSSHREIP